LPAAILEAFYCNVPVVAYNVGGIGEIVKPEETGWIVELHDEDGFAEAVKQALVKDSNLDGILYNAKRLVANRYLNKSITKEFVHVYQAVLGGQEMPVHQLN
jgi:glycosyltransferase involved in cell wall biosynthesis